MFRKALLVATASAFFVALGVSETSFAPGAAFAATKCGEGMRANWRGKCVKAKVAKAKPVAKKRLKRRSRSKAKNG
jgi:hypothetical protein